MAHRITMTDVAREAGVSLMTVSRVVNHKEDVSPPTRQRVLDIVERLGYRPSSIARGLVTQHTGTLGLVVPDIDNPFFSGIVRGAELEAYAEGYSVFLCNSNEGPERELAVLESLEEKQVDGVIVCSSRLEKKVLQSSLERFSAVVLVSRKLEDKRIGTVLIDDELGGRMATQHLLQTGHRNIGVISGPSISHSSRWRVKGYRKALESTSISFNLDYIEHDSPTVECGFEIARKLLTSHPELTALFCHNDLVAVGALQACARLNIRVPEDIAIVGFDDIPMAALVSPPLTTCRVPRYQLGAQAMRMLMENIAGPTSLTNEILLRPELVVRASAP